ncbi:putative membrane-bound spermidine synthase [Povalibacter uvarum]|uniref:Putative membrane-bound spermidine synthase n=1 Tax=Povalibacter uvarum TaxID=732238 RepID=A0A841HRF3_9GAMM|nr:fused MFS/spermidine synthase [Povalibacter uvarum]MBB6095224.1 putative membrane-bound spermidine synthase [Povalibacter uvarum]
MRSQNTSDISQPSSPDFSRGRVVVPALLLFASGVAALVYQLLWIKQLSLVVGADIHAITIAISAFFAGLAGGGLIFGRRADRTARPLRLYAALETVIAVLAVVATFLLAHLAGAFARLEVTVGPLAWLLPFALVGSPALLMGGTVPVLVRAIAPVDSQLARVGGVLYAANTAGAIVGTLFTVFAFIPAFGIRGSAVAAAMLNVAAAAGALWLAHREKAHSPAPANPVSRASLLNLPHARLALVLYSISGGIALGYEVIWSQVIVQWTSTRSFAFAIVLATYLVGLSVGSWIYARRAARITDLWSTFGLLIALAGVSALLAVAMLGDWLQPLQVGAATLAFKLTGAEPIAMAARFFLASTWIVLIPTMLLGAAFPVALKLIASADYAGHDTGVIISFNTIGGIVGTALTGFVLIPGLGLERSLALMAIGACIIGAIAVLQSRASPQLRWGTFACGIVALIVAASISPQHLASLLAKARNGELVFFEPGAGGTVAVVMQKNGDNAFRRLYVDGVSNSGDSMTSLRYMRLQALLPLIIHRGEPKSALVIGLGTGITSGSLLSYPTLDTRVVAELLPGIVHAAPLFEGNFDVTNDDRVEIRVRDGRRELLQSEQRYDLITLEPPPPSAAGVVNLYSTDFYRIAARRLNEHGLVAQWLPLPTQTDADTRSLVRSFLDVFPHASVWTTELHEMLLIGSLSPLELDARRIARRFDQPQVRAALSEVGISSPQALVSTWIMNRDGLERYAANARPVTDDDPRIEYGPWVLPDDFAKVLPPLLELRSDPPLMNADRVFVAETLAQRERLLRFYAAGLHAYRGERDLWSRTLRSVIEEEPGNPYYRWIGGR